MKIKEVQILMLLFIFSNFFSVNFTCEYRNASQCRDLTSLGNQALNFFATRGSVSELKTIFQGFNVVRTVGSQGHKDVQRFIKNHFSRLGWDVLEDNFTATTPVGSKEFANIAVSSAKNAPHRLVLACHFDSKDFGTELGGLPFLGATDSAVPCAILLHLASTLHQGLRQQRDLGLDLIFFDGEEAFGQWTDDNSIYGAKHLASRWATEKFVPYGQSSRQPCIKLKSITAFVLLDLIGERGLQLHNLYTDNACSTAIYDLFQHTEARLKELNRISPSVSDIFGSGYYATRGGGMQDDHLPFLQAGLNIVHLIASPFPTVWHTARDNELALDWTTISNLNDITRVTIATYFELRPQHFETRSV